MLADSHELLEQVSGRLVRLHESMSNHHGFTGFLMAEEMNREVAEAIDEYLGGRLNEMFPVDNLGGIGQKLAEIHRSISGATEVKVSVGPRSLVMEIAGCDDFEFCELRHRGTVYSGCLPDMIIAAIAQRVLETPIKIKIIGGEGPCRKVMSPAWLVDLLSNLDELGADGVVIVSNDRVVFSHHETEAHAKALSNSILLAEDMASDSSPSIARIEGESIRVLLINSQNVSVSICLRHGADETAIAEEVSRRLQAAFKPLE